MARSEEIAIFGNLHNVGHVLLGEGEDVAVEEGHASVGRTQSLRYVDQAERGTEDHHKDPGNAIDAMHIPEEFREDRSHTSLLLPKPACLHKP